MPDLVLRILISCHCQSMSAFTINVCDTFHGMNDILQPYNKMPSHQVHAPCDLHAVHVNHCKMKIVCTWLLCALSKSHTYVINLCCLSTVLTGRQPCSLEQVFGVMIQVVGVAWLHPP